MAIELKPKRIILELLSIKAYLKQTSNNFNFRINYLSALKGEIKKANLELESSINCFVENRSDN
jgi:hypothetical protein